jgi:hypothetical protein
MRDCRKWRHFSVKDVSTSKVVFRCTLSEEILGALWILIAALVSDEEMQL